MQKRTKTEQEERGGQDELTALIRTGAQKLIAQALKVEVADLLATYAGQQDEQGHARVVLSGHHPTREIQTGIGPVTVQVPKVRSRAGGACHLPVGLGSALRTQDAELGSGPSLAVFEGNLDRGDAGGFGSVSWSRGEGPLR